MLRTDSSFTSEWIRTPATAARSSASVWKGAFFAFICMQHVHAMRSCGPKYSNPSTQLLQDVSFSFSVRAWANLRCWSIRVARVSRCCHFFFDGLRVPLVLTCSFVAGDVRVEGVVAVQALGLLGFSNVRVQPPSLRSRGILFPVAVSSR